MRFESNEQQKDVPQSSSRIGLQLQDADFKTPYYIDSQRRNANENLIASGVLTDLKIQTDSNQPAISAIDYGTTKLSENYYATGIVLNPPHEFHSSEEKLASFADAACRRMLDSRSYQNYFTSEKEKFVGIGEGLNTAKEQTKASAVAAWNAISDGTVANFLAKPNAINEPVSTAVCKVIEAASEDPNATNKLLARFGQSVGDASQHYSALSYKEQGKVIGETMFGCVNLEGSTDAAEAALTIADNIATHVDARVISVIEKSMQAIEKLKSASPEIAQQSMELLYEYVTRLHLTNPQLEYAGVPKGYFDHVPKPASKGDNFYAMAKAEGEDGALKGKKGLRKESEVATEINYQVDSETGRLQRTDLGKVRPSYLWPVIGEKFSPDCIRQSLEDSCMSASAEMVLRGKLTEAQLIPKLGRPGNIADLPALLGPEWTTGKGPTHLSELSEGGPWIAQMWEGGWTTKPKPPHIVVVDGLNPSGNVMIRDPQEGTGYEMKVADFLNTWSGQAAYRRVE